MTNVVRIASGDRWAYVPEDRIQRIEQFATLGAASVSGGQVILNSEAGPLAWDLVVSVSTPRPDPKDALRFVGKDSVDLALGEELRLGLAEGAFAYSDFSDVSLVRKPSLDVGFRLASQQVENGDIVLTLWPGEKRVVPAEATVKSKGVLLELAEQQEKGGRCFVCDEPGAHFLTVSSKSDGSAFLEAAKPEMVEAWLYCVGSKAAKAASDRFGLEQDGDGFVIRDGKTGRCYCGKFRHGRAEKERNDFERFELGRMLASKGIGAVIPLYELRKHGEEKA